MAQGTVPEPAIGNQVRRSCVLRIARAGYYSWLHKPLSDKAIDDLRLVKMIRESYAASGGVYGSNRVFLDLREAGETFGLNRVARLMRVNKIKAIRGYKAPRTKAGKPSLVTPNHLQRKFAVAHPDTVWVTDITYIRTWEGWLYLAAVMDLFSRKIIGWSMKPTMAQGIVIDAIMMAAWRRKPKQQVLVHSDQGSQYGSGDWHHFCKEHNLKPSMSRRGNCWDNAVASIRHAMRQEQSKRLTSTVFPLPLFWCKTNSVANTGI